MATDKKKSVKVRDLKPKTDAKGGGGRSLDAGRNPNAGRKNLQGAGKGFN